MTRHPEVDVAELAGFARYSCLTPQCLRSARRTLTKHIGSNSIKTNQLRNDGQTLGSSTVRDSADRHFGDIARRAVNRNWNPFRKLPQLLLKPRGFLYQ
jgi:hypothetical protein